MNLTETIRRMQFSQEVEEVEEIEEAENLDEISQQTKRNYVSKALDHLQFSADGEGYAAGRQDAKRKKPLGAKAKTSDYDNTMRHINNRKKGIMRAMGKTNEEYEEIEEASEVGGGATGTSKVADPTTTKAKAPGNSKDQGDKNIINPPEHGLNLATDDTDPENNTKPTADTSARNKASVAAKPSAAGGSMKEHISVMFDGEDLSEEFMQKASTIFEAAVTERVNDAIAELEEQYTNALNEKLEEIEQQNVEELETLTNKLDEYLNYAVAEWMQENRLAVEHSLRSEITEEFISGLRTLFAENYIDVPEEKFNVVEELSARVKDLEEKLNEAINENIELTASLNEMTCDEVFDEVSEGLASTQVEKFKKLAEGVEYDSVDSFRKKLEIIKESYFSTGKVVKKTTGLLEESFEGEEEKVIAGPMAHYVKAISKNIVK